MNADPGWRIRVEHVTRFHYDGAAYASYNEVRKVPQTNAHQTRLEAKLSTSPHSTQYTYWDYWGTQVVAFNVDQGHPELVVASSALVETKPATPMPTCGWDQLAAATDEMSEYLAETQRTCITPDLDAVVAEHRGPDPATTVGNLLAWVNHHLDYVPGVTGVQTSAAEAAAAGRGVCQDFAHLATALLRRAGVPTRYVSGYLHPDPAAAVGEEVTGESHAWIETWLGEWWGFDPTNDLEVGPRHLVVARGRDYADVPPVKGVYAGDAEHEMQVLVTVTRMA